MDDLDSDAVRSNDVEHGTGADTSFELDPTAQAFDESQTMGGLGVTHCIGIGGAGMSVLAEMLHEQGVDVSGSDNQSSATTDHLRDLGINVQFGQRAEQVQGAQTVVYSSAIKPDNPEIVAAYANGARIVHRSDILALLMSTKRTVAVAGAHGKTTTSSLLAHILHTAGTGELADPSYAIGGSLQGADGSSLDGGHVGVGSALVAEADESDGSFAKYHPEIAVITNVEADHLDHYKTAERYQAAFVQYAGHAVGHVVICADDAGALAVVNALDTQTLAHTVVYSTQPLERALHNGANDLRGAAFVRISAESESAQDGSEHFTVQMPYDIVAGASGGHESAQEVSAMTPIRVSLSIPGVHNARNAAAAIISATLLGMDPALAAEAAGSFLGAVRRFQIRGQIAGVTVVDDYAHHPTEIAALLDAARRRYPNSTIHVLFQPHLFSRTRFFARQFAESLAKADDVIVTGIYPSRERQQDFPGVTSSLIINEAARMVHAHTQGWITGIDDMHRAAHQLAVRAREGDVIFTVGAGDIVKMDEVLFDELGTRNVARNADGAVKP